MNNDPKSSKKKNKLSINQLIDKYHCEKPFRDEVNEALEASGIVLEQESEGVFQRVGYKVNEAKYIDRDDTGMEKTRQIDIFAIKDFKVINFFKENNIAPSVYFIGDCKYYSDSQSCFVLTRIENEHLKNMLLRFPLFINGSIYSLNFTDDCILAKDFINIFGNIVISRRLENFGFRYLKIDRNEQTIFDFCDKQILPAIKFYYDYYFKSPVLLHQYNHVLTIRDISKLNLHIPIFLLIPIIVTNRKLIELVIDKKSYEIKELVDHPYILYSHTPASHDKFVSILDNYPEQSVLIVNNNNLKNAILSIEKGINTIISDIDVRITKNPILMEKDAESYSGKLKDKFNIDL